MSHSNPEEFAQEKVSRVNLYQSNKALINSADEFIFQACKTKYTYNFTWFGLPVIQFPEDILALQEIIVEVAPNVIVETGVARGGSLVFYASILKMLGKTKVIGVDVEILEFNRENIARNVFSDMIELVVGDSTSLETFVKVKSKITNGDKVMICLDSNHSEKHVYSELKLYSELVSVGSYLVVFDSTVSKLSQAQVTQLSKLYSVKDWGKENNPGSAVIKFLKEDSRFEYDKYYENKALISNCRGGFLKRIK
jgi:cephalosporin hydroxylase